MYPVIQCSTCAKPQTEIKVSEDKEMIACPAYPKGISLDIIESRVNCPHYVELPGLPKELRRKV